MSNNTDEWTELEKLAKAATPGPWFMDSSWSRLGDQMSLRPADGMRVDTLRPLGWASSGNDEVRKDFVFIAASNPQTILTLIALARSEAVLREALNKINDHRNYPSWVIWTKYTLDIADGALAESDRLRGVK